MSIIIPNMLKLLLILVFVLIVLLSCINGKILIPKRGVPPIGAPDARAVYPDWGLFETRVDHFNPIDGRTWFVRYMNNSQFFKEDGPLFIFIGGEWEITAGYLLTGQMFDMAAEHGGYMFYTEHRFYGRSYPLPDLTTESLKYLSTDQALADLVYFITKQKELPHFRNSKVVVVGGSYSANLATWARQRYPHIIDAALSSSAPIEAIVDFYGYYEVVSDNIKLNSPQCWNTINEGVAAMVKLLNSTEGIKELSILLNSCETLRTDEPYYSFIFGSITKIFAGIVQYAYIGQINYECEKLLNKPGNSLQKLSSYVRDQYGGSCMGDYKEFLEYYSDTQAETKAGRQWYYQTCTEFGYYQTTTSNNTPFGHTVQLDMFFGICKDIFGKNFTEHVVRRGVEKTNIINGALNLDVTKVISIHGTVDPWHVAGLLQDLSPLAPAFLVNGTSHCADLSSMSSQDLPQMYAVKKRSKELIAEWITK